MTNSLSQKSDDSAHTNAIIQTPIKPTFTQSLPILNPSFVAHCKAFEIFSLPSDTFLTIHILLEAEKYDPVLSSVYTWLKQKQGPYILIHLLKANSFHYTYYKQFQQLYIDPTSHPIQYYTPNGKYLKECS